MNRNTVAVYPQARLNSLPGSTVATIVVPGGVMAVRIERGFGGVGEGQRIARRRAGVG